MLSVETLAQHDWFTHLWDDYPFIGALLAAAKVTLYSSLKVMQELIIAEGHPIPVVSFFIMYFL
jgi:hypothetical protein